MRVLHKKMYKKSVKRHLSINMRPDIGYVINIISQFIHNAKDSYR